MSPRRRWLVRGFALGMVLALGALLMPQAALDTPAAMAGLGRLSPLAAPPLGMAARAVLAVLAIVAGLLLGWLGGVLFGRGEAYDQEEFDADQASAGPTIEMRDSGWRRPVPEPAMAEPLAAPAPGDQFAPAMGEQFGPVTADAFPTAKPDAPDYSPREMAEAATSNPVTEFTSSPGPGPLHNAFGSRADEAHETLGEPESMPPASVLTAFEHDRLDRIEEALAGLARRAPMETIGRFDALEARLSELSQQVAEIAGLARATMRTPAGPMASVSANQPPPEPARASLPPPGDPDRRRAVAEAARALRARLDGAANAG